MRTGSFSIGTPPGPSGCVLGVNCIPGGSISAQTAFGWSGTCDYDCNFQSYSPFDPHIYNLTTPNYITTAMQPYNSTTFIPTTTYTGTPQTGIISTLPIRRQWSTASNAMIARTNQSTIGAQDSGSSPSFSPVGGTYSTAQTVTISTATSGATIHYTVDGSMPTASSPTYSSPIRVSTNETVEAIAIATGYGTSAVGSAAYVISAPSTPAFVQQCNNYTYDNHISCTLTGVAAGHALVIGMYDSGSPTVTSSSGTPTSIINGSDGHMHGYLLSNTASGSITITATYAASTSLWLTVSEFSNVASSPLDTYAPGYCSGYCTSLHFTHFTTTAANDVLWSFCSAPGGASVTTGTAPITWNAITSPSGSGEAVQVEYGVAGTAGTSWGECEGTSLSEIVTIALKASGTPVAATPTFSPAAGSYATAQTVTLSTSTSGATVHYTVDGSTPIASSATYSSPITVSTSETVKAIALKTGYTNSAVGSAAYVIGTPAYVQACSNAVYDTTVSCTLPAAVGAGHALIIGVYGAGTLTSVTSTSGTPTSVVSDGGYMRAYLVSNTSSGTVTITANYAAAARLWITVSEYTNVASSPLDASATSTCPGYCATITSNTFNTTTGSDMLWSYCSAPGGATVNAGTAPITWTALSTAAGSGEDLLAEYGLAGAAGAYTGQCNGASLSTIVTVALKHP